VFGLLKALFLVLRIPIYLAQIKLKLLLWHNDLHTSKAARIIYFPPRKFDEIILKLNYKPWIVEVKQQQSHSSTLAKSKLKISVKVKEDRCEFASSSCQTEKSKGKTE
jgi:hypothetical protein